MNWRIYRLPGSREIWHIDSGDGTQVINVHAWQSSVAVQSFDRGGSIHPRAYISVNFAELYVNETRTSVGHVVRIGQFIQSVHSGPAITEPDCKHRAAFCRSECADAKEGEKKDEQ